MGDSVMTVVGGRMVLTKGKDNSLDQIISSESEKIHFSFSVIAPVEPLRLPADGAAADDAAGQRDEQLDGPRRHQHQHRHQHSHGHRHPAAATAATATAPAPAPAPGDQSFHAK